jgi:hypothetical protein
MLITSVVLNSRQPYAVLPASVSAGWSTYCSITMKAPMLGIHMAVHQVYVFWKSGMREDVNWRSEVVDSNIQLISEEYLILLAIAAYRGHSLVANRLLEDGPNVNCTSNGSCKLPLLAPVH